MKCINCGTDNNLQDRTANSGRCKNCNHQFAFEPTSMASTQGIKFTDPFFAKVIDDISLNKTLSFTPKQLLYFLDKRLKFRSINLAGLGCVGLFFLVWSTIFFGGFLSAVTNGASFLLVPAIFIIGVLILLFNLSRSQALTYQARQKAVKLLLFLAGLILFIGISISLNFKSFPLFAASTLIGMFFIYWGIKQSRTKKFIAQTFLISLTQVQEWLQRWQSINGSIDKLLPPSSAANQAVQLNPEILNYSFDRVVVCQSSEIAHFLIANNFHFENNCAVVSINRYPENIFDTVLQMLRQNPDLKVYALHNANSRGVSLIYHIRTAENWFANSTATIYDIGLSPSQILNNPKLFVQQSETMVQEAKELSPEIRQTLLPEEIEWLEAGYFVELESFSPGHLLRIVTQGIALNRQEDDLILLEDNSSYMVQSFG